MESFDSARISLEEAHFYWALCRVIRCRSLIHRGFGVTLGDGVLIDGLSHEGIVLGNHVSIGDYTHLEASRTITDIGK